MSMTLAQKIRQWSSELAQAGAPDAKADAEWIASEVMGLNRVQLALARDTVPTQEQEQRMEEYLARRKRREPLQYILGSQCFMDLKLKTDARALIPRPETELLAQRCVQAVRKAKKQRFRLLDIGTGTGALALAIADACPSVQAAGVDISADALSLARENAEKCGLSERVELLQSDLFSALDGREFDGIVSNPPYIPSHVIDSLEPEVALYEPRLVLDGGIQGYDFYERIIAQAPKHLCSGGFLALEAEPFQFARLSRLMKEAGFTESEPILDYAAEVRACIAIKK